MEILSLKPYVWGYGSRTRVFMKKNLRKVVALATATVLSLMLLAGCKSTTTKEEAPAEEAKTTSGVDISKEVEIVMYVLGEQPSGFEDMMVEFNKLTKQEINATLKVNWIGWGDYQDKYPLLLSSGETIDLIYTATWLNFYQQAQKGAFMALEDLLPKYAPKSLEQTSEIARQEASIDGHMYCLPSGKSTYNAYGPIVRGDLMEKYGISDIKNFDDLGKYLQAIKDNEPSMQPTDFFSAGSELDDVYLMNHGMYPLTGNCGSIYWIDPNAEKPVVFAKHEWEKMPEFLDIVAKWSEAGYWSKSALSNKDDTMTENGKAGMNLNNMDNWASLSLKHPEWNFRFFNLVSQNEALSYVQDAMAIPNSAKNPERALMLLELLRTNQKAYDLFNYGIDGVDSKIHEDGTVEALRPDEFPLDNCGWGFRTNDFTRDTYGVPAQLAEMKKEVNASLTDNKFRAFVMDTNAVKNEYAAVQNVMSQYYDPLELGFVDAKSGLAELTKHMDDAGNAAVKAELQRQIDEFIAKYPK